MKAAYNGEDREFNIAREHVSYLEHSLGRGLFSVLQDFTAGRWTFRDVATVISFALHGPSRDDKLMIGLARQAMKVGMRESYGSVYRPHPDVIAVLERDGHGTHADLAANILTVAIFGDDALEAASDAA